jgi:hypothetical protein
MSLQPPCRDLIRLAVLFLKSAASRTKSNAVHIVSGDHLAEITRVGEPLG